MTIDQRAASDCSENQDPDRRESKKRRSMHFLNLGLLSVGLLFFVLGGVAQAQSGPIDTELIWGHRDPSTVRGFRILISSTEGVNAETREINVGLPNGTPTPVMTTYSARVEHERNEFVAVVAIGNDGQWSAPSNWGALLPTRPGQPVVISP